MAGQAATLYKPPKQADDDDDEDDLYNIALVLGPLTTITMLVAFACPWFFALPIGAVLTVVLGPFFLIYLSLRALIQHGPSVLRGVERVFLRLVMMGLRLATGVAKGVYDKVVGRAQRGSLDMTAMRYDYAG
jgi:hypothetical protein